MKIKHLIYTSILFLALQSSAHATAYQVDFTMYGISGFNVNDHDSFPSGDPDLYFAMGISTNGSATEMNLETFFRLNPPTGIKCA